MLLQTGVMGASLNKSDRRSKDVRTPRYEASSASGYYLVLNGNSTRSSCSLNITVRLMAKGLLEEEVLIFPSLAGEHWSVR